MADGRRQGFLRRFRGDRTNGIILKESPIQVLLEDGVDGPALPRSIVEPESASLLTLAHLYRQYKSF
jgi:hypothetical protein